MAAIIGSPVPQPFGPELVVLAMILKTQSRENPVASQITFELFPVAASQTT
jgi:hypothetical protein